MENKQEFGPGDVVQLKSGGPVMTVYDIIDNQTVRCEWFPFNRETGYDSKTIVKGFLPSMLMLVSKTSGGKYFVVESAEHKLLSIK